MSVRLGLRSAGLGCLLAVLGAFPVAALVALVFRFPIPFTGYCSGPGAVLSSFVAVLMPRSHPILGEENIAFDDEEVDDMRKDDMRHCTRDLLLVERAREWLLEEGD